MRRQVDARGVPADIMMPRVLLVVASFLLVLVGLVMVFSASWMLSMEPPSLNRLKYSLYRG